ncbi:flagellar hook-length control protein FliK [Hyphomicrobium sp.]|jgi:hypothetical protein|uniref:flagellar hook-length control protein FliK n=1 Tax=Hyphomicrobium sp. TaxID=82 RepID=UPI00356B31A2
MTAAVGSAAGGGTEALLQTVAGKASSSGHRDLGKPTGDAKSDADETSRSSSRGEIDASDAQVDKAAKTSKRKNGKSKADDDDSSFEETFDNIGQGESKETAAKSGNATAFLPDLAMMRMAANPTLSTQSNTTEVPLEAQQAAVRPTALLQQKNILALMDTKDRLSLGGGEMTSDSATDIGTTAIDPFAAPSDDTTEAVPITIDRRETHWNFRNDALMSAASQISTSQFAIRNLPRPAVVQGTAPAGAAKEQPVDTKASNGAAQNLVSSQAVAMPDADQSTNSSFTNSGNGGQRDAEFQNQAAAAPGSDRKAGKAESTSSLDQIFSTDAPPQQIPPNATTQVRNSVLDSLAADGTNVRATTVDLPTRSSPTPVLRTLDLTLSPPDLGSVKLHLSLKANSLSIEAETSKAATAKLLNDDRPNLERGLKDAGYDISSVKITDASASTSSNSSGWQANGSPSRDGDPARSGFGGRQDGEMQRRDGSPSDQAQRRPKDDNPKAAQAEVVGGRGGNAVYI